MDSATPASALAAQRARDEAYDLKIRTMTEEHLAKRKAKRDALAEKAAAVLLAAGFSPSIRDDKEYVTSPGWTIRPRGDGLSVQSEPLFFTEDQQAAMKAATTHEGWMQVTNECNEDRYAYVRDRLAAYRSALVAAGWEVQLFDSESVWIVSLYAEPALEEN
jgi:UDP-N-acetylglucosamine enolpyruvyl transferase